MISITFSLKDQVNLNNKLSISPLINGIQNGHQIKLGAITDIELSGQYESGYQTVQGDIKAQCMPILE